MMEAYHQSVLLRETIEYLRIQPGKKYIDGTLGGGGHTEAILAAGGSVLALDVDTEAIGFVKEKIHRSTPAVTLGKNLVLARGNFKDIDTIAKEHGWIPVAGILLDIGVSSHQIDTPERGFSFQKSGPLDMRMDQSLSVTARDLVNGLTKQELSDLFYRLGEEHQSRRIAHEIVKAREKHPIETTDELEKLIRHALGGRVRTTGKVTGIHPATKVFQALRIAINDELHVLEETLPKAVQLLEKNGRLAVISFHSMEDRIVKKSFLAFAAEGLGVVVTDKPVTASEEELEKNIRARSAKLRIFEKTI